MSSLVVGADIGGTSTRIAVADLEGEVLALAAGGPGNPNSVGLAGSAAQIRTVMDRALGLIEGNVVSVVIGLAGGSRASTAPRFLRAAVSERVDVVAQLVSDLSVAFSSATPARGGYVIVAGTGAVAGRVVDAALVDQRDGWGWLLGDDGSGFWMGRQAVRVTLDGLQRGLSQTPLQRAVLAVSGAAGYSELLQACYSATPTWLASFSPLVSQYAERDPLADRIAQRAAAKLERLLFSLVPGAREPIVLAGSVLTRPGPVSTAFRARLAARATNPVLTSTNGVIGAVWIGLQSRVSDAPKVHDRLVATIEQWL